MTVNGTRWVNLVGGTLATWTVLARGMETLADHLAARIQRWVVRCRESHREVTSPVELTPEAAAAAAADDEADAAEVDAETWDQVAELRALVAERREDEWRDRVLAEARLRRHTAPDAAELDILARLEALCLDLADPLAADAYSDATLRITRRFRDESVRRIDDVCQLIIRGAELTAAETLVLMETDVALIPVAATGHAVTEAVAA